MGILSLISRSLFWGAYFLKTIFIDLEIGEDHTLAFLGSSSLVHFSSIRGIWWTLESFCGRGAILSIVKVLSGTHESTFWRRSNHGWGTLILNWALRGNLKRFSADDRLSLREYILLVSDWMFSFFIRRSSLNNWMNSNFIKLLRRIKAPLVDIDMAVVAHGFIVLDPSRSLGVAPKRTAWVGSWRESGRKTYHLLGDFQLIYIWVWALWVLVCINFIVSVSSLVRDGLQDVAFFKGSDVWWDI